MRARRVWQIVDFAKSPSYATHTHTHTHAPHRTHHHSLRTTISHASRLDHMATIRPPSSLSHFTSLLFEVATGMDPCALIIGIALAPASSLSCIGIASATGMPIGEALATGMPWDVGTTVAAPIWTPVAHLDGSADASGPIISGSGENGGFGPTCFTQQNMPKTFWHHWRELVVARVDKAAGNAHTEADGQQTSAVTRNPCASSAAWVSSA